MFGQECQMTNFQLTELVMCCNDLIRNDIKYEGDDTEKEKQQGRALSERQKVCIFCTIQS